MFYSVRGEGSPEKLQVLKATFHTCTGAASPVLEAGTLGDQGDWTVPELGMLDKVGVDFVCPVCELCLFPGTGVMAVDKYGLVHYSQRDGRVKLN